MRRGAAAMTELRILATTDLHMHVLSYDYFAERPSDSFGLERTAALIAAERATATNSLLLDNGDFLQGNPMGDYLAETSRTARHRPHPAIAAMNLLQYDAATLGNHDFSFGLPFLERTLSGAQFPYVSTNITRGAGLPLVDRIVLRRELMGQDGIRRPIAIGLLGFLPPQTAEWEPELRGVMEIDDILIAAERGIAALKQDGADLIIALSHSGIGPLAASPRMENAATALAALPGIDVVIAGHTHRIFPAPDHGDSPGIDAELGALAGKPCGDGGVLGFASGGHQPDAGADGPGSLADRGLHQPREARAEGREPLLFAEGSDAGVASRHDPAFPAAHRLWNDASDQPFHPCGP